MSGFGYGNSAVFRRPSDTGYDADAQAYFNAVTTPFSTARKAIINTLVTTLKTDGNWTKLDRLWLLATEAQDQALISLVNPAATAMTLVNAPAFVAEQGFTGDGATSYINTNFAPDPDGVNFTQNSASMGVYSRTDIAEASIDYGSEGAWSSWFILKNTDNNFYARINDGATLLIAMPNTLGFFVQERTAANVKTAYKNGASIGTNADASLILNIYPFFICARNNSGSMDSPTTKQYSIAFAGSGTINQATLYTAIQTYMTSLGTQV